MAGGWGPQQLATELVDDLRQIFLAALAPELSAASGPSLERFSSLAATMGLPRVVRSMEILGHALVDMREAPDAQVVLEIALVRAVRPDLDSGMEALSDRVSVLERAISGAAAFPRPGARARTGQSPTAPSPMAQSPTGTTPAVDAPAPATSPPAEVARRPSIGAVRRSQRAAAEAAAAAGAPEGDAPPAEPPGPAPHRRPRRHRRAPAPAQSASPTPAPAPASGVDRDTLTEAWGDEILKALPARAKALYSAGRFVAVDEQGAHFALPNAAHRDRCADLTPTVEAALGAHFDAPVTLVLDIDDEAAPPAPGAGRVPPPAAGAGPTETEDELVDPAEFADGGGGGAGEDQASAAQARLLQAFPGASEVHG